MPCPRGVRLALTCRRALNGIERLFPCEGAGSASVIDMDQNSAILRSLALRFGARFMPITHRHSIMHEILAMQGDGRTGTSS